MPIKKKKISELPEAGSLVGLYTIGVDNENKSVKAGLEFVKTAADNANEAAENANVATEVANAATSNANAATQAANAATEAASQATKDATDAAKNANDATATANEATQKTLEATTVANEATTKATIAADNAGRATEASNNATNAANQATQNAIKATENAVSATEAADTATEQAKQATTAANTAATNANTAADSANEAAENANNLKSYVDETFSTKEETTKSLAEKIYKVVIPTIVSKVSLEADESSVKLSVINKKTDNGSETLEETFLPVASEDQHGIMPSESFRQIATNTADIELLKGVGRVSVHLGEEPTQEQLSFAWTAVKGLSIPEGATIVNLDQSAPAGHAWTYFEISTDVYEWQDRGTDTVNQATNEVLGIVKGVGTGKGKVFVENDGTMSVLGWDELEAGSAKNMVTLDTVQEIKGTKTFTENITINKTPGLTPQVLFGINGAYNGNVGYDSIAKLVFVRNVLTNQSLRLYDDSRILTFHDGVSDNTIWHAGNSNRSDVDWGALNIFARYSVRLFDKVAISTIDSADTWLRFNVNNHFTSGIFCGSSLVRTDGRLEVGAAGEQFYATNSGDVFVRRNITVSSAQDYGAIMRNGTGNVYNTLSFEARGLANVSYPGYGFHQPNNFAGSLLMVAASTYRFTDQSATGLGNLEVYSLRSSGGIYLNNLTANSISHIRISNGSSGRQWGIKSGYYQTNEVDFSITDDSSTTTPAFYIIANINKAGFNSGVIINPYARGTVGSYDEGLRINVSDTAYGTIAIGSGIAGTSAKTWSIHRTNAGNFAIDRNGSSGANGLSINQSGSVGIGYAHNAIPSYKLAVKGGVYIEGEWVRTTEATGWLNQTYGGGWYMADSTYIRNYGSKQLYMNAYATFTAGAGTGSDMRYKKNHFEVPSLLEDIQKIKIFGYNWERQGDESYTTIGLNGNELEKHDVFKYFTRRENESDKLLTVDYGKLAVTVAVMGIQALYEENTKLKKALGVVCDKLNLNMEDLL